MGAQHLPHAAHGPPPIPMPPHPGLPGAPGLPPSSAAMNFPPSAAGLGGAASHLASLKDEKGKRIHCLIKSTLSFFVSNLPVV